MSDPFSAPPVEFAPQPKAAAQTLPPSVSQPAAQPAAQPALAMPFEGLPVEAVPQPVPGAHNGAHPGTHSGTHPGAYPGMYSGAHHPAAARSLPHEATHRPVLPQSVFHPVPQPAPQQPVAQAAPQPVAQPVPQPVAQPVPQPMMAPVQAAAPAEPVAQPVQQAAPQPAPQPAPAAPQPAAPQAVPAEFAYEGEHPVLPIPFTVTFGDSRLKGTALSVAAAYAAIAGALDQRWVGQRAQVVLKFDFEGFSVSVPADITVAGSRNPGEMTLQFADPLGPHLPQLRHILNSYISGDLVTLGSFLSYTGPTKPKAARPIESTPLSRRIRSVAVAAGSVAVIALAGWLMANRATTATEMRPVFITRDGQPMRATTAGQVSYLNPAAAQGEVLFSVNSNTGDVLNFQLPCDCAVELTAGMYQGATVLPEDVILTILPENAGVRVQTQISVTGLNRVMNGARAWLDVNEGPSLPVTIRTSNATTLAAERGDIFVPVEIVTEAGALTDADIGRTARLRIVAPFLSNLLSPPTGEAS